MVFLLRSFVGLLHAFWSRVAAAQTSKAREERKARRRKSGAACAEGTAEHSHGF